jgi:hypothetical protein
MNRLSESIKIKMQNKYSSKGNKNLFENKNQSQNFSVAQFSQST